MIRRAVKAALDRRSAFRPYAVRAPIALDITFKNYRPAEMLAYLPGVERQDAHTVRFTAQDMVTISRFIEFAMTYEPGLSP
jgi:D-amino peptidase